jgi:hypothetical protein
MITRSEGEEKQKQGARLKPQSQSPSIIRRRVEILHLNGKRGNSATISQTKEDSSLLDCFRRSQEVFTLPLPCDNVIFTLRWNQDADFWNKSKGAILQLWMTCKTPFHIIPVYDLLIQFQTVFQLALTPQSLTVRQTMFIQVSEADLHG